MAYYHGLYSWSPLSPLAFWLRRPWAASTVKIRQNNAFTTECSKKLLPTIIAQQLKLWQLVERSASVSQSARGDSGIVCCFAVGALIGIALLLVLSGRLLAGILWKN